MWNTDSIVSQGPDSSESNYGHAGRLWEMFTEIGIWLISPSDLFLTLPGIFKGIFGSVFKIEIFALIFPHKWCDSSKCLFCPGFCFYPSFFTGKTGTGNTAFTG